MVDTNPSDSSASPIASPPTSSPNRATAADQAVRSPADSASSLEDLCSSTASIRLIPSPKTKHLSAPTSSPTPHARSPLASLVDLEAGVASLKSDADAMTHQLWIKNRMRLLALLLFLAFLIALAIASPIHPRRIKKSTSGQSVPSSTIGRDTPTLPIYNATFSGASGDDSPWYENGVVASENPTCSEMGVEILKLGGSAVDAAITGLLCVGVIDCFSSGLGG